MKATAVENLVKFYLTAKQMYPSSYSLRTLCRALLFAADNMFGSFDFSLYEAVCMAFLTNLEAEEKTVMKKKILAAFPLAGPPVFPTPANPSDYVKVQGYWLERGTLLPQEDKKYVVTSTVKQNLAEIARIVCSGRFPVLLEGETSAGKTSIVCHIAKVTGNEVVRINNHEHTDIQEYMGSYVADSGGRLVFREGALVKAVRQGAWVILDELNLASTDVIEALNRLLDDNRELFVPELNETIKAHKRFRLFATQNPAGSYSGRKKLSRALLSRFVVLKFHHLPLNELSEMVCTRCGVAPSAANKMIDVLSELRIKRSLSSLFSARDGLMTLRDVFRWAKRLATDETTDDWLQVLVNHGYFLLAGRCRNDKDEQTVVETLEKIIKRKVEKENLFSLTSPYMPKESETAKVVLTKGMRRMLVLTEQSWLRNEAVLMVGETGGGKTSLAEVVSRGQLRSINCHERTETADLLGRLRPKQNGGFEWSDGVVIAAMRDGVPLLIDEISLAEDSVLERLNPLFEEDRTLLLSDAGVEAQVVHSSDGFKLIATMNPGGDYGKKELSKALRNRFTEVWTSSDYTENELVEIFDQRLERVDSTKEEALLKPTKTSRIIVKWIQVFFEKYGHVFRHFPSVRDVVSCAELYSSAIAAEVDANNAIRDAICAVFLDALSGKTVTMAINAEDVQKDAILMLNEKMQEVRENETIVESPIFENILIKQTSESLNIGHLKIKFGSNKPFMPKGFSLNAPTCVENFYRIARGLLINKPILLEGAPGCGKSSTVMALAQLTGNPITRLNLSDQTDLSDLFGSDVPVLTDDGGITFRWEDGPILKAIKNGEWVLLDEMNLASQSVLEGLNACFDHRKTLYIAELNRTFEIPSDSNCRFFACQNPRVQGGNRRALPKSFVNRFTNIYTNDLTTKDTEIILAGIDETSVFTDELRRAMVRVNEQCAAAADRGQFAGGPHSFNLRDLLRWFDLAVKWNSIENGFEVIYASRMRNEEDVEAIRAIFQKEVGKSTVYPAVMLSVDEKSIRIGKTELPRGTQQLRTSHRLLSSQMKTIHQLATSIQRNYLTLLVGPRNCGKRAVVESLAAITGRKLNTISLNADTDAQELIGSYEQVVDDTIVQRIREELLKVIGEPTKKLAEAEDMIQLEAAVEMIISERPEVAQQCRQILEESNSSVMRFEWVDSTFVNTYLNGDWLLIEDVNLCSAAVLDRLNSCLETSGKLVISERQNSYEPLSPHPDFRVILAMDPKSGEVSRAMRNRSVEVFIGEKERWFTSSNDVSSVVGINEKTAEKVKNLDVDKQLLLSVLIESKDLSTSSALRILGIDDAYDGVDDERSQIPPMIVTLTEELDQWLVENWKRAAQSAKCSNVEAMLLVFLATSPTLEVVKKVFGSVAAPFVEKLTKLVESKRSHPLDATFNQGQLAWNENGVERFNRAVVSEWAHQLTTKIQSDGSSAEQLSRTMTKYEMATSELAFKNLPLMAGLMDAIVDAFQTDQVSATSKTTFSVQISLLLLVAAARRKLSARTGCAAIYLAWNQLREVVNESKENVKFGPNLQKAITALNQGWTCEAHQIFLNVYFTRWKKNPIVKPFTCAEQVQRFTTRLEEIMARRTTTEVEDEEMRDEDEEQVPILGESPIDVAMKLAECLEHVQRFVANGVLDENCKIFNDVLPYLGLNWTGDYQSRFIQNAALLATTLSTNDTVDPTDIESTSTAVACIPLVGAHSFGAKAFFSAVHYDPSLATLSVGHLQNLAIRQLATKLWKSSVNTRVLNESLSEVLQTLTNGLEGWNINVALENTMGARFQQGKEIMKNAVPPEDTLDPVVFEEERITFLKAKKRMVENQLRLLATWRSNVSRQEHADQLSDHPVISRLTEMKKELDMAEDTLEAPIQEVFRQPASMYNTLCAELRSFLKVTTSTVADANSDESNLELKVSRVFSFLMSAANFRNTLLRKYTSFADVTSPFIAGLLLVECAFKELADITIRQLRRTQLEQTTAYPRIVQTMLTATGLTSNEVTAWAVRDASPMPLRLKVAVMKKRLAAEAEPLFDIQWTRNQWKKWYERNVAKAAEKDFEYKSKTEEEKDELDMLSFFSMEASDKQILDDMDMSTLLEAMDEVKKKDLEDEERFAMATAWIRNVMTNVGTMPKDDVTSVFSIHGDQSLLETITTGIDAEIKVVDVYRQASLPECRRVAQMLDKLTLATKKVQERWPEVAALKNILRVIDEFFAIPTSTPHVKLTNQIEKLLEECDQWEKIADRANSLREPLADLRHLLVDWKKMEVRCWTNLLERTENEGKRRTQLVAYPLFDALCNAETKEASAALIAMSCEWMHNATLLDFSTRIASVDSLATWAKRLGKPLLSAQLRSAAAHFGQFIPPVDARLKAARDPTVNHLQDYLKIVKYNDVNLLNIKVSSQKAHAQLFKFVRRFKEAVGVQVDQDFNNLLPVDDWKPILTVSEEKVDDKLAVKAQKLGKKIIETALAMADHAVFRDLTEQAKCADGSIRTMINYVGEDEEKEKQQGYERNSRQREVAMMLKQAQSLGWNARRAVALNAENINQLSVTHVLPGDVEKYIRLCSSGRNLVIQKANKVDQQVGISTRKHLLGMIEYGMYYELLLQKKLKSWGKWTKEYQKMIESAKILAENQKTSWNIDHSELEEKRGKVDEKLEVISAFVAVIKSKISAIPEVDSHFSMVEDHLHPLAKLTKNDPEAKKLLEWTQTFSGLFESMLASQKNLGVGPVFAKETYELWKEQLESYAEKLQEDAKIMKTYLEVETREIHKLLDDVKNLLKIDVTDMPTVELETAKIQLLIQSLYKGIVEETERKARESTIREEIKHLDKMTTVVNALEKTIGEDTSSEMLKKIIKKMASARINFHGLEAAIQLAEQALQPINVCLQQLTDALAYFCILYRAVVSMTVQLFEKGYVNTIPKAEKQESGDGQTDESGEGGGMGEGGTAQDAKDVTDEMEETGQIEGLQDETPADSEEHESKNSNEKPIDMEDDFAEDLQDIDKNEPGDQKDDEEDKSDEEEAEPEDQMGDVDEEDEKQLDPKLWDEEDEEEEKKDEQMDIDQENDGADDQTNEMVAKDDAKPKDDQEDGKNEEDPKAPEEEDEMENMDEREQEDGKEEDSKEKATEGPIGEEEDEEEIGDDGDAEEAGMEEDDDETDKEEDGDEQVNGSDVEDGEQKEDEDDTAQQAQNEEAEEKNDQNEEKMEQGSGGEKRDKEENDRQEGGQNEDEEDEKKEDEEEQKGEGKKKNDPRGEDGKGDDAREENQEKNEEENEDESEQKEEETRKRKLAEDDGLVEEEAEQGEGEENETGQQMEDAPTSERQMRGSGTLEEAKQTNQKREEKKEEERKNKKRKLKEGAADEAGAEGGEVEDENATEEKQAMIHLSAPEQLAEEMGKELTLGQVEEEDEGRVEEPMETDEKTAQEKWQAIARDVGHMASELAENLRLILEPQRANKMQGDYRSGKRLNMRRLIPYIASEYRKDRIWMRRTKHAQREYQIMIAVDDSGSMDENGIHQVTCQSVCVVEEALRRCDAGSVSVVSFGSDVTTIVPFGDSSASTSVDIIKKLTFGQKSTDLLQMLRHSRAKLDEVRTGTSEQMLIIISDGRGALSQGADKVKALYSQLQNVTVLFVILDSGPKSINTLTVASFQNNSVVLKPYLSLFPFPYYAVINNIQQLPHVIAESIRQWFEVTSVH